MVPADNINSLWLTRCISTTWWCQIGASALAVLQMHRIWGLSCYKHGSRNDPHNCHRHVYAGTYGACGSLGKFSTAKLSKKVQYTICACTLGLEVWQETLIEVGRKLSLCPAQYGVWTCCFCRYVKLKTETHTRGYKLRACFVPYEWRVPSLFSFSLDSGHCGRVTLIYCLF